METTSHSQLLNTGCVRSTECPLCIPIPFQAPNSPGRVRSPPCLGSKYCYCPLAWAAMSFPLCHSMKPPAGLPALTFVPYSLVSTCNSESSFENASRVLFPPLLKVLQSRPCPPVTRYEKSLVVSLSSSPATLPLPPAPPSAPPRMPQACTCPRALALAHLMPGTLLSRLLAYRLPRLLQVFA